MRVPLLLQVLRGSRDPRACSAAEWGRLVQQARRAGLLAELARRLEGAEADLPEGARHALRWARAAKARQDRLLRWELQCLLEALAPLGIPVGLLKGAAYLAAGFAFARGRLFHDIDLLVPAAALQRVERALFVAGYVQVDADPYDQRYYREWMHELPPLQHARRGTLVDVHHGLAPPTSRYAFPAERLFPAMVPLEGTDLPLVPRRLGDEDLVLHAALHLYTESEFRHGLRDLLDLCGLLGEMERRRAEFGGRLVARARALGLARPLYLALRHAAWLLGDARAGALAARLEADAPWAVGVYDACFGRALLPAHPDCEDAFSGLARGLLYVRGHWLRMPLRLLVPHLARKAWRGMKAERTP